MNEAAYNEAKTTGELTKQLANAFIDRGLSLPPLSPAPAVIWRRHSVRNPIPPPFMILALLPLVTGRSRHCSAYRPVRWKNIPQ